MTRMVWWQTVAEAFSGGEYFRLAMLVWAALFTVGAGLISGLKLHLFIEDRLLVSRDLHLPKNFGPWLGLIAGLAATAFTDFGL